MSGTRKISEQFERVRSDNRAALTMFVTAGFPRVASLPGLAVTLESAGVDFLEIGMPFSDPLADGPVIQASSHRALANGMTLQRLLPQVREVRQRVAIPLVLMGYLNPIVAFGMERFFDKAADAGVDGMILPELPLEESGRVAALLRDRDLAHILLVTPTTAAARVRRMDRACSGFLYCVSTVGVTGQRSRSPVGRYLQMVKRHARKNPVQVGFGIRTPDDAAHMGQHADGVIVGSALLQAMERVGTGQQLRKWVGEFRHRLRRR